MATQWSDYQQTKGYMEWFYYVKFTVVVIFTLGFAWFSISRVIAALKSSPPKKANQPNRTDPKRSESAVGNKGHQ